MKNLFFILMLGLVLLSCKNNTQSPEVKTVDTKESVTNDDYDPSNAEYATTEFSIKGMTCEMGCARTIENKLKRTQGVKTAKVDFEAETAVVEFDKNALTESQIDEVVESVGDGSTYKVEHTGK